MHKSCFEELTSYAAPGQHVYSTGMRVCLAKCKSNSFDSSTCPSICNYEGPEWSSNLQRNSFVFAYSASLLIFTILSSNEFETHSFAVNMLGPSHLLSIVRCLCMEVYLNLLLSEG